jgi:hypothetical protein
MGAMGRGASMALLWWLLRLLSSTVVRLVPVGIVGLYGSPWASLGLPGASWSLGLPGLPWASLGFLWFPWASLGLPGPFGHLHGSPWVPMGLPGPFGNPWASLGLPGLGLPGPLWACLGLLGNCFHRIVSMVQHCTGLRRLKRCILFAIIHHPASQ